MMLIFWHWFPIQRLKIYKNRGQKLAAAWSMHLSGDYQSQAARRAVSTWKGDRLLLAKIHSCSTQREAVFSETTLVSL